MMKASSKIHCKKINIQHEIFGLYKILVLAFIVVIMYDLIPPSAPCMMFIPVGTQTAIV